jgi:hypothetical protein
MDVVQLIYRPDEPQGSLKDFEFSRLTMELRWQQGFADARTTLQASPWLAPMAVQCNCATARPNLDATFLISANCRACCK